MKKLLAFAFTLFFLTAAYGEGLRVQFQFQAPFDLGIPPGKVSQRENIANLNRYLAEDRGNFYGSFKPCFKMTTERFVSAYHPGANSRESVHLGRLNENTPGTGFECYFNEYAFIHGTDLVNSQWGKAYLISIGARADVMRYEGFSLNVALEAGYLEYGVPRYNTVVKAILPLPSIGIGWTPWRGEIGTIGIRQYFLPESIKLYSVTWEKKF